MFADRLKLWVVKECVYLLLKNTNTFVKGLFSLAKPTFLNSAPSKSSNLAKTTMKVKSFFGFHFAM